MDTKGKIYVAVSMGYKGITEISNRCRISTIEVNKVCWNAVKSKDMTYNRYNGIEVMGDVLHFYLTKAGKQEMRIYCMELRINQLEQRIKEYDAK